MTSPVGASSEPNPGAELQPNPDQVNEFHRYADTDNSPESTHHTLGNDPNQSSPGDHDHDGRNSKLLSSTSHAHTDPFTFHMVNKQLPAGSNLNQLLQSGYYDLNNGVNVPPLGGGSWYHVLVLNHNNNNLYIIQKAWRLDGADQREWQRQCIAGTWSPWSLTSPVLLGWGSVTPFNVTAVSHRIKVSVNLEFASGQVGKLSVVVTNSNGAVMNDNVMNVGGDASTAGRDQATSLTKYFNCDPGDVITITPQSFSGTINRIEIYVEACN